jgi:hypothetical protein
MVQVQIPIQPFVVGASLVSKLGFIQALPGQFLSETMLIVYPFGRVIQEAGLVSWMSRALVSVSTACLFCPSLVSCWFHDSRVFSSLSSSSLLNPQLISLHASDRTSP